jgi:hypothetical protein
MCKIFLKNKKLYEEKIKNLLLDVVNHEKIRDVRICLSKVLKRIIGNEKELLYKDQIIHQICYKLKSDNLPIINHIFSDVNIKYNNINIENKDNIIDKNKKYFKGDNEFFIQEFKIEVEKKSSIFFLDRSNKKLVSIKVKRKVNDPKKGDKKDIKKEEGKNEKDKIEDKKEEEKIVDNEEDKIEVKKNIKDKSSLDENNKEEPINSDDKDNIKNNVDKKEDNNKINNNETKNKEDKENNEKNKNNNEIKEQENNKENENEIEKQNHETKNEEIKE